jgi:hypothetical protein
MPPHLVPDPHLEELRGPGRNDEEIDFLIDLKFREWTYEHGLTIVFHPSPPRWAKRWIGMVTTGDPFNDHTMLMSGPDCLFDPAHLLPPGEDEATALNGYGVGDIDYGFTIERI